MQHLKEFGIDTFNASIKAVPLVKTDYYSRDVVSWKEIYKNEKGELKYQKTHHNVINRVYDVEVKYVDAKCDDYTDLDDDYVFTLQDIMELLPKYIEIGNNIYWLTITPGWCICYEEHIEIKKAFYADSMLEAAYEMLCWCAENGYLKGGKR